MKVVRPVVQMTFTQKNCETEMFSPFFCRIVYRMLTDPEETDDPEQNMQAVRDIDEQFISGEIDTDDPAGVVVTVEHADVSGSGYGVCRLPVVFSDVLESKEHLLSLVCAGAERLMADPGEPSPTTPVVIILDDSRCGWVQAEKWGEEYGAIILWWPMVADQCSGVERMSGAREGDRPPDGHDYWERGRKIGYKHGFSEGFYQAKKEAEDKAKRNKSTGK